MTQLAVLRQKLEDHWQALCKVGRQTVQLMEVCGTHTVAVARGGLHGLLPKGLRLVSGPGCPVCVTDQSYMDQAVHLARHQRDVIIATYGDMLRVPGRGG
jgi:hydrogenase expression/formation protein HypD